MERDLQWYFWLSSVVVGGGGGRGNSIQDTAGGSVATQYRDWLSLHWCQACWSQNRRQCRLQLSHKYSGEISAVITTALIRSPTSPYTSQRRAGRENWIKEEKIGFFFFISIHRHEMSLMTCEKERGGNQNISHLIIISFYLSPSVETRESFPQYKVFASRRIAVTWTVFNSAGKTSKGKGQVAILKVASLHLPLKGIRSFQILKQNIPNISSAECWLLHWKYLEYFRWLLILNASKNYWYVSWFWMKCSNISLTSDWHSLIKILNFCFHRWNPGWIQLWDKYYRSWFKGNSFIIGVPSCLLRAIRDRHD